MEPSTKASVRYIPQTNVLQCLKTFSKVLETNNIISIYSLYLTVSLTLLDFTLSLSQQKYILIHSRSHVMLLFPAEISNRNTPEITKHGPLELNCGVITSLNNFFSHNVMIQSSLIKTALHGTHTNGKSYKKEYRSDKSCR